MWKLFVKIWNAVPVLQTPTSELNYSKQLLSYKSVFIYFTAIDSTGFRAFTPHMTFFFKWLTHSSFCFLFFLPLKTARRLISLTQSALGLQDLGQLHYQPLKDSQGTLVISSTCHLANIKAIPSSLNFKWLPLSKLQQRRSATNEESTASDLLLASLQVSIPQWA